MPLQDGLTVVSVRWCRYCGSQMPKWSMWEKAMVCVFCSDLEPSQTVRTAWGENLRALLRNS